MEVSRDVIDSAPGAYIYQGAVSVNGVLEHYFTLA